MWEGEHLLTMGGRKSTSPGDRFASNGWVPGRPGPLMELKTSILELEAPGPNDR